MGKHSNVGTVLFAAETADSLEMRLKSMYRKVQVKTVEGMAAFRCRKGKADEQG